MHFHYSSIHPLLIIWVFDRVSFQVPTHSTQTRSEEVSNIHPDYVLRNYREQYHHPIHIN
jgi:hypothetical protein